MKNSAVFCVVLAASACSDIELDAPREIVHARFDPDDKVIPMPTNVLRDDEAGRLDVPVDDDDLTPAELEFYEFLNTTDGWSTAMPATVELTAPIDPATVNEDTLQVWQWRGVPQRVDGARVTIDDDEQKLTIDAPREGWERGGTYVVLMRGGDAGVEGKRGEPVECDAAFYFLRQTEALDTPQHERAFPGDTRAERMENASDLEQIRLELAPYFDYFAQNGVPRDEVAALWEFTITERTELAMDKPSQRMPIPNNLLLDPATGLVDLPAAEWDSEVEVEAKRRLRDYDGFGTSAELLFELTAPMDAATITPESVKLYELGTPPLEIAADVVLMDDLQHVRVIPHQLPLAEKTSYAVVVDRSVRDAQGGEVLPMPVGHFLKARTPVFANGASEVGAVADEDAERVENVRLELVSLLDRIGRDDVVAAWPFTTMTINSNLEADVVMAETLDVPVDPGNFVHLTPGEALADFPLAIASLFQVGHVYNGTIKSPVFLDDRTRAWREDGGYEVQDIAFTMTVPANADPDEPLPVVIFGHGIMTERRFVLTIGDALAQRGFAAIAIDFPMHGTRTHCFHGGPLSLIDPTTGELTSLEPCANGTTCAEDGRCVDETGQGNDLAAWPIINMNVASGAAYIEVEHIANTKDHFRQTLVDLGALSRALRKGDWKPGIGYDLKTDELYFAGMSLGGIIGGTYVSLSPEIKRAVLNVPGADTVDLFTNSTFFGPHVDAFFTREDIADGTFEAERFMNVARWFMDAVDPQNVAHRLTEGRDVLIQMATLDFIIPNEYTLLLEELSGAPRRDYVGEHAFLAIPIEPAYLPGVNDLADFLAGELTP
jgi:dienelactone hydrolase